MKTYTIKYSCDNCGISTTKKYNKGIVATNSIICENCGCTAIKDCGLTPKSPKRTNPFDDIPYRPEDIEPWITPKKPNPYTWPYNKPYKEYWLENKPIWKYTPSQTYDGRNQNYLYDGHTIMCSYT